MKSKYIIMKPGKGSTVPMRGVPRDNNEVDYRIKINSTRFEKGFEYATTWEILAWKKPIFIGECCEE